MRSGILIPPQAGTSTKPSALYIRTALGILVLRVSKWMRR